jgi:hypothetical protein
VRYQGKITGWKDDKGFGWPGALAAQRLLRHKSSKQSFQFVFWVTVILNCCVLAWFFSASGAEALHSMLGAA